MKIHSNRFRPGLRSLTGSGAVAILGLLVFACRPPASSAVEPNAGGPKETKTEATEEQLSDLLPFERSLVEVFQKVSPSVVNISNLAQRRMSRFSLSVQELPQGTGTGFVWDKQGHIVTNFHVIAGADAVSVNLDDQTTRRAKLVGAYPSKDIAVLKIDLPPEKLTPVVVGTSRNLLVGQGVLAIGNPFGLDHSLTTGVVSALGREIKALDGRPIQDVIQTDASINPGNSGGPLLDSKGRLIGMNTAIFSPSGTSAGIGFAIPVDIVKDIVTQIIEKGKVTRPGLGVELFPDSVAARLRLDGCIISEVVSQSAADTAGLRGTRRTQDGDIELGDVIVELNSRKITSNDDLFKAMEKYKVGDEVELTVNRAKQSKKVKVKLQAIE